MSFLVVAACLAVQWFLNFSGASYQWNWTTSYIDLIRKYFSKLMVGYGLFGEAIFVLPILIVASIVFTLVYHLLGHAGYLILSLVLLWYCLDVTEIKTTVNSRDISTVFITAYQKIFALLFWYFIFGPVGLVLYVVVHTLNTHFATAQGDTAHLQKYFALTLGVLDWVPVRLLGLSFALAGNFGAVFKEWIKTVLQGITTDLSLLTTCGAAAMANQNTEETKALLQRALLIWLVVMALAQIGIWIG